MKLRYTLTRWDLFRAQLRGFMCNNRALLWLILIAAIYMFYTSMTGSYTADHSLVVKLLTAFMMVCVVIGAAFLGGMTVTVLNLFLSKGKGVLGEHTLEVTEEGLEERTEFNVSLQRWNGIPRVLKIGRSYMIYITDASAHVIPPPSGILEGDAEQFIATVRAKIKTD
ncbi:YcxB family protein [Rariglobus hedericola]|uniref:YcxB family protein n=1 Tax=Rariglobus hedericola TaxID=2597822 RepID=A0A556QLK4_9BACT|nr:YcxB family protein [Rariglobus hedericola]TSJ77505.1 YcxB family protein [Rariglobus hedericola]